MASNNFCPQCGVKTPEAAKFCSACGQSLSVGASIGKGLSTAASRTPRFARLSGANWLFVGALTAALTGSGWYIKSNLAGTKPNVSYEEMSAKKDPVKTNPELKSLRETAEKTPGDVQGWRNLGSVLLAELQSAETPSQQLIFETIEVLRKVLDLDASDQFALLNMADISMNQQVFDKAVDYYSRYLKNSPTDSLARSRYASALAFTGKADEAVVELTSVLKAEPTNFAALAYLAVTYAQMGKKPLALEVGERALTNAPSDEARARFSSFLDSVKNEEVATSSGPALQTPRGNISSASTPSGLAGIDAFIRANEIAGPKFDRAAFVDGMVALYFKEFPMDKMPPFVREKFTSGVLEKVKALVPEATSISFVDSATGAEMVGVKTGS
jgi:tetratricopeptide (TPR) repeat protein